MAQMAMMFSVAAEGLSIREAACNWLRAPDNAKEWTTWIPAQVCPVGTRLDTSSVNGSSCQECPPGSVSQGVRATACTKCAAGTRTRTHARAHGMLMGKRIHAHGRRTPCAGFFQPDSGQFGCLSCDSLGDFYQELEGQPNCRQCVNHTRRYLGVLSAASRSSCQCKEGVYSRCVPCIAVEWHSSSCVGYYKPSPTPNPTPSPNLQPTRSEGDAEEVYS
jgi:hypothetical protein